ncbi:hypothetical protein [Gorillibacterium massiliense]|uniref:hypothetical protein n=1 Tax=Gorillibacterium massiliense TaxID=1280390 RepID=UPI0004BA048D|nr:hypothetical protein [Gorillibacterium massiliense]
MQKWNAWLGRLAHEYTLIVFAAVLFFTAKAIIAYYSYRHYDKKLDRIEQQVQELSRRKNMPKS